MTRASDAAGTTRVAAYALVRDDAAGVLLVRVAPGYPSAGQWTLPGGGLDFGEHPAHAALRELTEETGLTGEIEALAFVDSWTRPADPRSGDGAWHAIHDLDRVRLSGGSLRHEQEESTDMAAWFTPADARGLPLVPLARRALDEIGTA
jgi:8-oxo-dGTP diphosphatase